MFFIFIALLTLEVEETYSLGELSIVKMGRALGNRGHTLIMYRGGASLSETMAI